SLMLDGELAGIGSGLPGQQVNLRQPHVDGSSLRLFTLAGTVWQEWSARDDFDSSTRTDFHFVPNAATGAMRFGTGERGQTPPADCMILVRYRTTYAAAGNVAQAIVSHARVSAFNDFYLKALPAATRDQLKTIPTNRTAAAGGAELET